MKQKIAKRLPARTVHKRPSMKRPASSSCRRPAAIPLRRPASVMKSIYNKGKKGDRQRCQIRWSMALCGCASGQQKERYTHENGKKGFTFSMLPKPALAPDGKSRGKASMKHAISTCVSKRPSLSMIPGKVHRLQMKRCASSLPRQWTIPLVGVTAPQDFIPMTLSRSLLAWNPWCVKGMVECPFNPHLRLMRQRQRMRLWTWGISMNMPSVSTLAPHSIMYWKALQLVSPV